MRVGLESLATTQAPRAREQDGAARQVEAKRTPLKPSEIRRALSDAYRKLHGKAISQKTLDVLSAQVMNETGLGQSMFNFNFGGIKGASPEGLTARYGTREVLGGETRHITDGFRAYGSSTAGAVDYLSFLERKYPRAVDSAEQGDVDGFVAHLKAGHYFTADEAQYAAAVKNLLSADDADAARRGTPSPSAGAPTGAPPVDASSFATSETLLRVYDAMTSSAVAIAAPSGDEDRGL